MDGKGKPASTFRTNCTTTSNTNRAKKRGSTKAHDDEASVRRRVAREHFGMIQKVLAREAQCDVG